MTMHCTYHKKEHDHYEWRSFGSDMTFCKDALDELEKSMPESEGKSFNIGASSTDKRIGHWQDIKSRVTTHDGQFLSGKAGREYQQKYSKQYLGKDLSQPTDWSAPQYQKELSKPKTK